ncbi:MAG: TetR/AcrR family transcriptional regulator [Bacteroidales bacterium]
MDPKTKIIETSLELFLQRGCKSVTMDDIAKENGISKRTLYEVFINKSQLLEKCISLMYLQMSDCANEFKDKSTNVIDLLFKLHDSQSDLLFDLKRNFFTELKRYYYQIYKKSIEHFVDFHKKMTHNYIIRGQREGLIKQDINIQLVSKIIIEISSVLENSEVFTLKNYSRKELFREVIIFYIRGICTSTGIELIDSKCSPNQILRDTIINITE